ncbi:hypothetical protein NXF25_019693 [Crotalus adamanteus]|uniref:Dilute domain-containing protein n=1 Tax=Crotalus adamanteus TaxID=8729 RepID=A0AAW1B2N6_CROAD
MYFLLKYPFSSLLTVIFRCNCCSFMYLNIFKQKLMGIPEW